MKCALLISIFFAVVLCCFAAQGRGYYKDPAHPGKCVIEGKVLSPGESSTQTSYKCARVDCQEDSLAVISTCGAEAPPPGCKLGEPEDETKEYPGCCKKKIICP